MTSARVCSPSIKKTAIRLSLSVLAGAAACADLVGADFDVASRDDPSMVAASGGAGGAVSAGGTSGAGNGGQAGDGGGAGDGGATPCAADEVEFLASGHCYFLGADVMDWDGASSACDLRGAGWYLATITSQEEHDFILSTLSPPTVWIGATDRAREGTYEWVSGESWSYTNWNISSGQPNGGVSQNCVRQEPGGTWWDDECTTTREYVCERGS